MLRSRGTALLRATKAAACAPAREGVSMVTQARPGSAPSRCTLMGHPCAPPPAAGRRVLTSWPQCVRAQVAPAAAAAVDARGVHRAAAAEPAQAGGAGWRRGAALAGGLAGFAAMGSVALAEDESEHGLHAPRHPWPHDGIFSAYDHAAIRRGHQVYTQVCAACHSMYQIHYRDLVGVAYTEEEVKSMAAEARWPLAHFILRRSGARALGLPAAPDGAALARRSRSQTAPTTRASSMSGLAA